MGLLIDTLPPDRRDSLFALMRRFGDEELYYMQQGRETPGTIPVGPALFDEVIKGAARQELLQALRTAAGPEEAFNTARAALKIWVVNHNNRRRRDIGWGRWENFGQSELERLIRAVQVVIG